MENSNIIIQKLSNLESLLLGKKKILTLDELVDYTGFSKSTLYKKVQKKIIPSSNPDGKKLFFDREKIDEWLLSGQNSSNQEVYRTAQSYVFNNRKKA